MRLVDPRKLDSALFRKRAYRLECRLAEWEALRSYLLEPPEPLRLTHQTENLLRLGGRTSVRQLNDWWMLRPSREGVDQCVEVNAADEDE